MGFESGDFTNWDTAQCQNPRIWRWKVKAYKGQKANGEEITHYSSVLTEIISDSENDVNHIVEPPTPILFLLPEDGKWHKVECHAHVGAYKIDGQWIFPS